MLPSCMKLLIFCRFPEVVTDAELCHPFPVLRRVRRCYYDHRPMGAFGTFSDLTEYRGAVAFRQVEVEEYQVGTGRFVGLTYAFNSSRLNRPKMRSACFCSKPMPLSRTPITHCSPSR
jgi:hypothetical protein